MAGFSIDEVRETFEADISSFLSKIEAAGNALLACNALAPLPLPDGQGFALLGDLFHTLYGTSMLVGARSLADTAGRLERLSESGAATLQRIVSQQQEVRELAKVCLAGAQEMRGMLSLELAHESERAKRLAQDFERNSLRAPSRPSRAFSEGTNEFDFQPKEQLTAPAPPGIEEELLIVFREEASDAAAQARRHFETLRDSPADVSALGALERLFHKLKGAAAGVGWEGLRDRAAALQARLESMLDGSADLSVAAVLPKLADDASSLLVEAGLPPLVIAGLTAAGDDEISYGESPAEPDAAHATRRAREKLEQMFRHELASSADTLKGHLQALLAAPDDFAAASEVEKIFMSLKGAAGSAGLDDVSQLAARLQADAESVAVRSVKVTLDLVRGIAHRTNLLFARAGLDPSSALPRSSEHEDSRLIRELFAAEARQILERATRLLDDLKSASHWRAAEPISELGRLFHHLKGSALVSNEEETAARASRLQELCEADDALARLPEIRTATEQLARELGPAPGATAQAQSAPAFPVVREAVEVMREPALWEAFSHECMDLLEQLDASILGLDTSADPKRVLQGIFRLYHTLKGTVGTVGLAPMARALHLIEDFLEESLEMTALPPLRGLSSLFLALQTDIRRQLAQCRKGYIETSPEKIRAAIAGLRSGSPVLGQLVASAAVGRSDSQSRVGSRSGDSREQVSDDDAAPLASPQIRVAAERLDQLMDLAGELVVSRSRLMTRVSVLQGLERELGRNNERLLGVVNDFCDKHEFTSIAGASAPGRSLALASASGDVMREGSTWGKFTELELDRYDDVNVLSRSLAEISDDIGQVGSAIVGEIVSFADDSDAFGALVTGIQNEVTRARMVALTSTFTRLSILARDAADQSGKEIEVVLEGENVSLDKAVADALFAPMLHLVRNAVAHGIEPARAREGAGKPRRGKVVLSAREDAGQVVVEVRDDGQGFDLEALQRRGVEMGLIDRSVAPSDPRVRDLVFQPGVTTQKRVGRISGRGIGCDVVRRAVERLNGSIAVTTEAKVGTSFVLFLPITLAITNALLVRNAGRLVAIPLYFSERIIDREEVTLTRTGGVQRIELDNVFVKVHPLAELFGGPRSEGTGPLLVLRLGQRRCVLSVDSLVGQEEIVVKSTGGMLAGHPLLAGVSIRGTGDLVLVLDVPALVDASAPAMLTREAAHEGEPRAAAQPQLEEATPPARAPDALTLAAAQRLVRDVRIQPVIRALFVDDSLSVRKVAEKTLRGLGVEVVLAVDGVDALAKLREHDVDIVFTDLEMPRMHGYDLIRELRFVAAYKTLPVIVVSSRSGNKHKQQATELGATDYLIKPFSPEIIRAALDRHCSGGREPQAPPPVIVRTP
jgi:chemosensory pili system protein ChpA (sensor histidine kinase/response regulator)